MMVAMFAPTARLAEVTVITVPTSARSPRKTGVFLKSLVDQLIGQVCRQPHTDHVIHVRRLALDDRTGNP